MPRAVEYQNGMGYVYAFTRDRIPPERAAALLRALRVRSVRSWHSATWVLADPDTVDRASADGFHVMYRLLLDAGVTQIVGMSGDWYLEEEGALVPGRSRVPRRDATPGSAYRRFLDRYERTWETLVTEFPEVHAWETGNEMNHEPFLHPVDAVPGDDATGFTLVERADICTDMMFRSARAIRAKAPHAEIIMPGMAPIGERGLGVVADNIAVEYEGMVQTLERIYDNIEGGAFGSADPRDFFDALCWHPYYAQQDAAGDWHWKRPDAEWVRLNRGVYDVALRHGDGGRGVYLSEFGYNDYGDPAIDEQVARYVAEGLRLAREELGFVRSVHVYRMFPALEPGNPERDEYSLFDLRGDGTVLPKRKAYAVLAQHGGDAGALMM